MVGVLALAADIHHVQRSGDIVVARNDLVVDDIKVALADPCVGHGVVEQLHIAPVAALVAHEDDGGDVLVIFELELELEHLGGIDADNRACTSGEDTGDIVGVTLIAVGEVGLAGSDELSDVHGLGSLDYLQSAGGVGEADDVALDAVAFGDDLKTILIDRDLALGNDAQTL